MEVGEKIRKARKAAGMTQKELAESIGVYAKDVCRWEKGERQPGLKAFALICRVLGASADDMLDLK